MATQVTTYSTAGSHTYTAPATLLGGTVSVLVYGAAGSGGKSGKVVASVTLAASGTLTCVVGDNISAGFHPGGAGSAGAGTGGVAGKHGGGSSSVSSSVPTLLIEAGGGGASGGAAGSEAGGVGGNGGLTTTNGANGASTAHSGNIHGGGGGGGGGNQGNGAAGGTGGTGHGGTTVGAAGDSGSSSGTLAAGGGGGAGGSSFVASSGVSGATFQDGTGFGPVGEVIITATVADPPLSPNLVSPINGTFFDTNSSGITFVWNYEPATNSGTQTAYALRLSTDGGAYGYWNGTNFSSSTPVWNTSAGNSAAIPAAVLADGHTYGWSIATQESNNSLQGPFASDKILVSGIGPTVTWTSSTTFGIPNPTLTWTYTTDGSDVMTGGRVVVYTQAATLLPSFFPGTSVATYDSNHFPFASNGVGATGLSPGTWVAYIQISETGGFLSPWFSYTFTVAYDPPATPILSTTTGTDPVTGAPITTLTSSHFDNLLSYDDATFENASGASEGDWVAGANTTIASTATGQGLNNNFALQIEATSSGVSSAQTASGLSGCAVVGSTPYSGMITAESWTHSRVMTVELVWYTSAGTLISTTSGTGVTIPPPVSSGVTPSAWTQGTVSGTSPSNAAFVALKVSIAANAASDIFFLDEAGIFQTVTPPTWTRGGLIPTDTVDYLYSDDGGSTFLALRNGTGVAIPASTQQVSIIDNEAPFGATRQYAAITSAPITNPVTGQSVSAATVQSATIPNGPWYLTDPNDPTTVLSFNRVASTGSTSTQFTTTAASTNVEVPTSVEFDSTETMGIFNTWGNKYPIVQRGTVLAQNFVIAAYITGYTDYAIWQNLTGRVPQTPGAPPRQATLLLRSDMGQAWYVVVGPGVADQLLRAPDRVANPQWILTIPCIVTTKP